MVLRQAPCPHQPRGVVGTEGKARKAEHGHREYNELQRLERPVFPIEVPEMRRIAGPEDEEVDGDDNKRQDAEKRPAEA